MLSEENLRIIIPAAVALVSIALTYFFTKRHYERTRKWELKDRQFKEAYAYLDTYHNIVEIIENYETTILKIVKNHEELLKELSEGQEIDEKIKRRNEAYRTAFAEMPKLLWSGFELRASITILGDSKLSNLDDDLRSLVTPELGKLYHFIKRIDDADENEKFEDIDAELDRVDKFYEEARFVIADMKLRLDRLAQKV